VVRKLRPLALYLPQYYPFPENDKWWGKGFTEWRNVTKAKPLFEGHYQPHLPADFSFYDLRLSETRIAQAEMAAKHGIYGFCFYHYWFTGKTLLEKPVEGILNTKEPDFPFCLCWANENWTRKWDGLFNDVLIEQHYSDEDDLNHIRYLLPFFADKRYIRVDNKPVFIVYRTELFPDINRSAEIWRNEAIKSGIGDLYLIRIESFKSGIDPASVGFDAGFEFQPNWHNLPARKPIPMLETLLHKTGLKYSAYSDNRIWNYSDVVNHLINHPKKVDYKRYPGITPQWDNTSRRKTDAFIYHNSTPAEYGRWLQHVVDSFQPFSEQENFILINAWNEWAEGNHLEPCLKWGKAYLEETKKVLDSPGNLI
jgi:lipopolysaccharide biosynthesis protein